MAIEWIPAFNMAEFDSDRVFAALSAVAAAISSFFAFIQVRGVSKQSRASELTAQARLLMDIADRWNSIYHIRNEVRLMDLTVDHIFKDYQHAHDFMASERWLKIRSVAGFYEYLGTMIKRGYAPLDPILDLVTVDVALWNQLEPLIYHLRTVEKRTDLYVNFEYLIHAKLAQMGR
mgnify:CR=1 FL=1